jgi:hypothetical protein
VGVGQQALAKRGFAVLAPPYLRETKKEPLRARKTVELWRWLAAQRQK